MEDELIRRLHIGGKQPRAGWEILDALAGPHVDYIGDASDLSRFADCTFVALYASHVLEHFDYTDEVIPVLKEWRRVLRPGGTLYVSVPDLECLCRLYLTPGVTPPARFAIMRMMFGGHVDHYDYHMVGIDQSFLEYCLKSAGFASWQRLETFSLFNDNSDYAFMDTRISLNMVAERPLP